MEPPPVILAMAMPSHRRCVKQIRSALCYMPGVSGVSVLRRKGMVFVYGSMHMDAWMLKRRLTDYMGRTVTVVSDGGRLHRLHHQQIMHYGPPPPPAAYPYQQIMHYGPPPPPAAYPYQHAPPVAYPYQHAPPPPPYNRQRQYRVWPSVFDDTIPGNACTIM